MFYDPECSLSLWMLYVILRRMWILLLMGRRFFKFQFNQVDWWCYSGQLHLSPAWSKNNWKEFYSTFCHVFWQHHQVHTCSGLLCLVSVGSSHSLAQESLYFSLTLNDHFAECRILGFLQELSILVHSFLIYISSDDKSL
jgi:hypothetical protein